MLEPEKSAHKVQRHLKNDLLLFTPLKENLQSLKKGICLWRKKSIFFRKKDSENMRMYKNERYTLLTILFFTLGIFILNKKKNFSETEMAFSDNCFSVFFLFEITISF